jgi:hypothetical protein
LLCSNLLHQAVLPAGVFRFCHLALPYPSSSHDCHSFPWIRYSCQFVLVPIPSTTSSRKRNKVIYTFRTNVLPNGAHLVAPFSRHSIGGIYLNLSIPFGNWCTTNAYWRAILTSLVRLPKRTP